MEEDTINYQEFHYQVSRQHHNLAPSPSSSSSLQHHQGRRKPAPVMMSDDDGNSNYYRHRHGSPYYYEEKYQRQQRQRDQLVPLPPPTKLFIADQFKSTNSTTSHNDSRNAGQNNDVKVSQRLSIAELFMTHKKNPIQATTPTPQLIEEEEYGDGAKEKGAVDYNKNDSMIRRSSGSGFSRLFSSFQVENNINSSDIKASGLSLDSVPTPSADDRPLAQFVDQDRRYCALQQEQQKRSPVHPYQPNKNFRRCHCKCNNNAAKPKYLDLIEERTNKKSRLQKAEKDEEANTEKISINSTAYRRKSAITLFLTWPRTPLFRIDGATLLEPPKTSETDPSNTGNVAFDSTWSVSVTLDNRKNYIPLRFNMEIIVKESGTVIGRQATQQRQNVILSPQIISQINMPVHIDYEARRASDPTFANLRRACVEDTHEALQLQFWITIHYVGLEWTNYKPRIVATPATGGFLCPT
ncbi:hypothetical protein INT45_006979 [Circinella minor]|uniref:Uncharacterized protein n=1 Tax=Circinella minor TaxID=1195481 RepID=A0A8H7S507_9FUNG|nr:hypothetical protein INT45_006979 [Circinella minor]